MGGIRAFYKYVLSLVLFALGAICAYAFVVIIWNLPGNPNVLDLVWVALMAISSFLAFTNSYRSYSGRGRLPIEDKVEYGIQRLATIPVAISKLPIIGPVVFAVLFVSASTVVFSVVNRVLWHALLGSNSIGPASLVGAVGSLFFWPVMDSSVKISSIMLNLGRVVLVCLLVNTMFALPARRRLSWGPARAVFTAYGVVLIVGCTWLAIGIRELSSPLIGGSIPFLLGPGLSYWQLRRSWSGSGHP